ncbi:MAG: tetratricopeptide repeat protein [Desulfobulbaceae bacterium]|nr:tetratricopeptide repeat protein [Desulfobulbaceae bacterium]
MTEQSSLVGKEENTIDIERKESLLDELNLPPIVTRFIRENARNLQIVAGCIVLLVFAWTYFDYYTETRENNASSALSLAVLEADDGVRVELLQGVVNDFSGTDAAVWSKVEQAHVAFKAANYDEALSLYNDIFDDLASDSPLLPLLSYNMGLAYENNGDNNKALIYYAQLSGYKGFAAKGLIAQGRLYQLQGENQDALRVYREASDNVAVSAQEKSMLAEKVGALQAIGSGE